MELRRGRPNANVGQPPADRVEAWLLGLWDLGFWVLGLGWERKANLGLGVPERRMGLEQGSLL